MKQFDMGEMYYRLTYPGRGLLYPQVASFIFIGINLSDDAEGLSYWYFQFSETYANHGSVFQSNEGAKAVVRLKSEELHEMLDVEGLIKELKKSEKLRQDYKKLSSSKQ